MNSKKMSKRQQDIKSKLMAAIAMLLVSSIMMVSTTYAWFTLSTAPEVTGISTSVGANGNLEMALLPTSGDADTITTAVGDGAATKSVREKNLTWGNLVDLSDESYGLSEISLYPAALNTIAEAEQIEASLLKTPVYGADGRIEELKGETVTGIYESSNFNTSEEFGVRAVGNASGMSPRQTIYRNAVQAGSSNASLANNKVSKSLNARGSDLASIAIKHATADDSTTESYSTDDLESLRGMLDDLIGNDTTVGVLQHIELAYVKYIVAYVTSSAGLSQDADGDDLAVAFAATAGNAKTVAQLQAALQTHGVTLDMPDGVSDYLENLEGIWEDVNEANEALEALEDSGKTTFTWDEIQPVLTALVNPSELDLNGWAISDVKANPSGYFKKYTEDNGAIVNMSADAGVYSDIAKHVDDYEASIVIDSISYGDLALEDVPAKMKTQSGLANHYLYLLQTAAAGKSPSADGSTEAAPITDKYGYVIDLAFRTNAADSDLLLQTEEKNRIYSTDGSEETMGSGSTMTFSSSVPSFSDESLRNLMKAIRIVFFNPEGNANAILAYAKLDLSEAEVGTNGVTAPIKLYDPDNPQTTTYKYELAGEGDTATHYYNSTNSQAYPMTHYYDEESKVYVQKDDTHPATHCEVVAGTQYELPTHVQLSSTSNVYLEQGNAVITALDQNVAHAVSVLVYLDGDSVTNADVVATAETSATGTMNLQFASSANLVPMEYTALKNQGGSTESDSGSTTTTYKVTKASGSTENATISDGTYNADTKVMTFKVTGTPTEGKEFTVTYNSTALNAVNGVYTINDVSADVEVLITETDVSSGTN